MRYIHRLARMLALLIILSTPVSGPAGQLVETMLGGRATVAHAQGLPDLQPQSVSVLLPKGKLFIGQRFTAAFTVKNVGSGATANTWVDELYLSSDTIPDFGDRVLGNATWEGGPLAPGAEFTVQIDFTVPSTPPGTWYLLVRSDANNTLTESSKANNTFAIPVTVDYAPNPNPDLEVTSINAPAGPLLTGSEVTLGFTVVNSGTIPAAAAWADALFLSQDQALGPNDLTLRSGIYAGPPFDPGSTYQHSWTVTVPDVASGTWYLIAMTDQLGQKLEQSEANNVMVLAVQIQPWATPTPTATLTPEPAATETAISTATPTATVDIVAGSDPTETPTSEPKVTATETLVPTATPTETLVPTATPTETLVPTATPTETLVPTATPTETLVPTATPTETLVPTATATETLVPTATPTETLVPTATPTETLVPTATPTETLVPTATPTETLVPTATPTETLVPTATATATLGVIAGSEPTQTPTALPKVTVTQTAVPPTATPTRTPLPATATATRTPLPATATATRTPVPATPTKTSTPMATPAADGWTSGSGVLKDDDRSAAIAFALSCDDDRRPARLELLWRAPRDRDSRDRDDRRPEWDWDERHWNGRAWNVHEWRDREWDDADWDDRDWYNWGRSKRDRRGRDRDPDERRGGWNRFHLTDITTAQCWDDPAVNGNGNSRARDAGFDSHRGTGRGRLANGSRATIEWTVVDGGQPGRRDRVSLKVRDESGRIVFEVSDTLTPGRIEAHTR